MPGENKAKGSRQQYFCIIPPATLNLSLYIIIAIKNVKLSQP